MSEPGSRIRPALPAEAEALTALALRSKAHWGYDAEFMLRCGLDLTVTPKHMQHGRAVVLERGGRIIGFYTLTPRGNTLVELEHLFIEPDTIRTGAGRILFDHARDTAAIRGYKKMEIQSDPFAAGFYERCGATPAGMKESCSVPGRFLPMFEVVLQV